MHFCSVNHKFCDIAKKFLENWDEQNFLYDNKTGYRLNLRQITITLVKYSFEKLQISLALHKLVLQINIFFTTAHMYNFSKHTNICNFTLVELQIIYCVLAEIKTFTNFYYYYNSSHCFCKKSTNLSCKVSPYKIKKSPFSVLFFYDKSFSSLDRNHSYFQNTDI